MAGVLAMAGCQKQDQVAAPGGDPAPAHTRTIAPTSRPVPPTRGQGPVASPANNDFDRASFAGTFTGTLPCADCPGIDETLQLDADGRFELTDVYRARPDSTHVVHGTWSLQAERAQLRLDPDNQRDVDRVFAIDQEGTLAPLGMDGTRIHSPVDLTLKRNGP